MSSTQKSIIVYLLILINKTLANYALSVLAKGQAKITQKFNAPELRRQTPSVLGLALQNQDISIPRAQDLRTSPLRPVDVNFFTNIAPGTATAKFSSYQR
jgi:hypothetical protein